MKNNIRKTIGRTAFIIILGCLGFLFVRFIGVDTGMLWIKENVYWPLFAVTRSILKDTMLNTFFSLIVVFILTLERLYPVNPNQRTFSVGFMHDSAWLALGLLFEGMVVVAYVKILQNFCGTYLNFFDTTA